MRAEGGVPDAQVVGDTEGAVKWMRAQPGHNGKVGVFGSCSGGRHAFLYACHKKDVDACVELWGGRVVMAKEELNAKTPVSPIELTKNLSCPLLGLFGNEDRAPSPEQVDQHEAELKKHGKTYEFYRYDGAGHGFFAVDRPGYRPEQAVDGWKKVLAFYEKHLGLAVTSASEGSCFLRCGKDFVALFKARTPGLDHFCFTVDAYEAGDAVTRLRAAGLEPRRQADRVYFDDPDRIEVQVSAPNRFEG